MRIWTIHPKYLDAKGFVALWRETLLAKNVLENKTKGYKNHPQLIRFKNQKNPVEAVNRYLEIIFQESVNRNYKFDKTKFSKPVVRIKIKTTKGQLEFEFKHLLKKLKIRDKKRYAELRNLKKIHAHPMFEIIEGGLESWEKNA
ncbi:MAG: hypothetical protein IT569_08215 [Leptospiraceae bacterium]|nr:hypothetical protein [Leptospiraceae bacterium]